jgi:hypothetical protein
MKLFNLDDERVWWTSACTVMRFCCGRVRFVLLTVVSILVLFIVFFLETLLPTPYLWLLIYTVSPGGSLQSEENDYANHFEYKIYVNICPVWYCCRVTGVQNVCVVVKNEIRFWLRIYGLDHCYFPLNVAYRVFAIRRKIGVQRTAADVSVVHPTSLAGATARSICIAVYCARRHENVLHWREQLWSWQLRYHSLCPS